MPWPGLRAQPDQVRASEPTGVPSKAIASSRRKRIGHRSDLPHNADEKAKNLHVLSVLRAHFDFGEGWIISSQRKFVPPSVNPLQRGIILDSHGGDCPIRRVLLGIKHGYIAVKNASSVHARPTHAESKHPAAVEEMCGERE